MENKTLEQQAAQFADSLERRGCAYWNGLKNGFIAGHISRNDEIRDILIRYTENLRDYERESRNLIGFDERDDEEFVDIFLKGG